MKHLKKNSINIHILTYIYLLISILNGYIFVYLISLFIVFVHEMSHYMTALYFRFEIEKIEILPFGAYLLLKDMHLHDIKEELCVVLAGPATHLFLYYFISLLNESYLKEYLLTFNAFVFIFNMLPIYPMDGHRIISLLLQRFFDIKASLYMSLKISVMCFCVLSLFYFEIETMVIIVYLLGCQFQFFKDIPMYLRLFYSNISDTSLRKIIHDKYIYRRGFHNYYLIEGRLYDQKDVIYDLLKTIKNV